MVKSRSEVASIGGKIMALRQRKEALETYYQNPKICLWCSKAIEVQDFSRVAEVRRKKFCNRSCFGKFRIKPKSIKSRPRSLKQKLSRTLLLEKETLSSLVANRGNYQRARSTICKHARTKALKFFTEKKCVKCGYSLHVEVCHKKAVYNFEKDVTLEDINDINNLILLCPNHHWEFDNGLLKF